MTKNSSELGHYLVAICQGAAYIRVVGQGNMNNCGPLQSFVDQQRQLGIHELYFDLKDCKGFDSTFMGLLIGFRSAEEAKGPDAFDDDDWGVPSRSSAPGSAEDSASQEGARVYLVNSSSAHQKLLGEVGIDHLVEVSNRRIPCPESMNLLRLTPQVSSTEAHLGRVLKAHQNLIQANKKNESEFGTFLRMVQQELDRPPRP